MTTAGQRCYRLEQCPIYKVFYGVFYNCWFFSGSMTLDEFTINGSQAYNELGTWTGNSPRNRSGYVASPANEPFTYTVFLLFEDNIRLWERMTQVSPYWFQKKCPISCHNLVQNINNHHNSHWWICIYKVSLVQNPRNSENTVLNLNSVTNIQSLIKNKVLFDIMHGENELAKMLILASS